MSIPLGETVVENGNPLEALKSVTSVTDPRRKVRDFLRKYRHQGLPNAKKFRKATKIARLNQEAEMLHTMFIDLCKRVAAALAAVDMIAEESNWAVRSKQVEHPEGHLEDSDEMEVLWVNDGDPLEALKLIRTALDPNGTIPIRKESDLDGRNLEPVGAGHGEPDDPKPAVD